MTMTTPSKFALSETAVMREGNRDRSVSVAKQLRRLIRKELRQLRKQREEHPFSGQECSQ